MGTAFLAHLAGLRYRGELLWCVAKEASPKGITPAEGAWKGIFSQNLVDSP